jgi:hypothetical protein
VEIVNETPFVADRAVFLDKRGAEKLVLALKATFAISEQGLLTVAEEQDPLEPGDTFNGEPDSSSIAQESELGPVKRATDLFLQGSARPLQRGATWVQVGFQVGKLGIWATVFGNRVWTPAMGLAAISPPEPFEAVPLLWENAFGGWDTSPEKESHHDWEPANPVGRGFRAKHSELPWEGTPLPNIEDPANLIQSVDQRVKSIGFGPIGRHWKPRIDYAGTYDEAWLQRRAPLLPDDFDERFHNAAPPPLIFPGYMRGGEPISVTGCTPSGQLGFHLPRLSAGGQVQLRSREEVVPMEFNSVTVNTDRMTLNLLWKGEVLVHGEAPPVTRLEYGVAGGVD